MKTLFPVLTLLVFLPWFPSLAGASSSLPAATLGFQQSPAGTSTIATSQPATTRRVTAYTLPPDLYKKARDRSRIRFRFELISFVYGLVVLWLILRWNLAPKYRDWAEKGSSNRFLRSLVYSPLLLLTMAILTLPSDIYDNWTERKFGLSVQSWGSWAGDWMKAQLISLILGTILIWLLYVIVRQKRATLVVLFLADLASDRRVSYFPAAFGHRSHVPQV